jgi:hypothetical protein
MLGEHTFVLKHDYAERVGSHTIDGGGRNMLMAEKIERAPISDPVRFVVAGDTGAWPDPTSTTTADRPRSHAFTAR